LLLNLKEFKLEYTDTNPKGEEKHGPISPKPNKPSNLLSSGKFFERSKPLYGKNEVLNVLGLGAKNNGNSASASVNTESINKALKMAAAKNLVFVFPAGMHMVDDTLDIPPGSRLSGALWAQIMAVGKKFSDEKNPKVLAK
jgi:glucan 1,3-beta-glucosidase